MNIIHVTNLSNNKASGISSIVPNHIKWQSRFSNVFWYNLNDKYTPSEELKKLYNGLKDYSDYKIELLPQPFCYPDLVVFHGIYFYKYCKLANELNRRGIPYIVVPHGSLTHFAINQKKLKKKIGLTFLFKKFLKNARTIQYLTKGEYEASGHEWNRSHIIVPNGCAIPEFQKINFRKENIVGTFIGRKSIYYKGLDLLIEACYRIKKDLENNNCKIHIYGPDENGSTRRLNQSIQNYEMDKLIYVHDGIYDKEKREVLLDSDFFILTSRTEGHPVAVIEALSYGLPCFVTEGTNMATEVKKFNAGWGVQSEVQSICNGLIEVLGEVEKFSEKGNNARLLSRKYEWSTLARVTIEKYKELIQNN